MKRALVLSGGGNKGAFEVGAIYHLIKESKLEFDIFSGTSVGAVNSAYLAQSSNWLEQASNIEELKNKWFAISHNRDIYSFRLFNLIQILFGGALYQPTGLKNMIASLIHEDRLEKGKPLLIPTVSLEDGELCIADSRKAEDRADMIDYILASASMPIYFPPVTIRRKHWVDGGLRDMTPLAAVLNERPTEIYIITTYPVTATFDPIFPEFIKVHSTLAVLHRIVDILTSEIAGNDLKVVQKNALIKRRFQKQRTRIAVISPDEPFTEHCLKFNAALVRKYFELGVRAAQNLKIYG